MYIKTPEHFSDQELQEGWDVVALFGNEEGQTVAYRSKASGLLRLIDKETGFDMLAMFGNPITASIEEAKAKAEKIMAAQ